MSSVIHIPKRPDIGIRQLLMLLALMVAFLVVFLRLWYLQVVKSGELADRAQSLALNTVPTLAPRGLIEDRNGKLLAGVRSELVITAIPQVVNRNPEVLDKLAEITRLPVESLRQRLDNSKWRANMPSPIVTGVGIDVATKIAETGDQLPGIDVESKPVRYYPDPISFSHVLGYVSTPNDKDLARLTHAGLHPVDYVGKVGVEYLYEKELMGKAGSDSVELDSKRRPIRVVQGDSPVPGDRLVLTIDADLQKLAMDKLEEAQKESPGSGGAVVAIDPNTGEVLCLASNPSYDTNAFLEGLKSQSYADLANDPMKPLFNRAIRGAYSPGSTFKIVDTLASAKANTFDPNRVVYCPGYYEVGNRIARCLGHHGAIRYHEALYKSCNTYFSDLAIRTGPDELRAEALEVGLGKRSGIDLLGEGKALVPTDQWLAAVQKVPVGEKPKWYPGDTVNLGIGQGMLSVTPLQMADVVSLVANEGFCYRPHVVKQVESPDGGIKAPSTDPLWKTTVAPEVWAELKSAMVQVIESGTGRRAQTPGLTWAGKTGSTEHTNGGARTHSWFVGFAPADHPRIAIAAIVEQSGHGGEVAAPIAAAVVRRYLGLDKS